MPSLASAAQANPPCCRPPQRYKQDRLQYLRSVNVMRSTGPRRLVGVSSQASQDDQRSLWAGFAAAPHWLSQRRHPNVYLTYRPGPSWALVLP